MFHQLVNHNEDLRRLVVKGYAISFDSNYLVICDIPYLDEKKNLQIIVDANQGKLYGAADPVLIYSATGLEAGDDKKVFTGALSRAAGENVGTYAIIQGNLSAGNNYNISFTSVDFEIGRKTLTIKVNEGQQKYFSESDPMVLSYIASGFANGDNREIMTGTLQRVVGEAPGNYAIQLGTLSAGNNYEIAFLTADFTIVVVRIAEIFNPETVSVDWGTDKAAILLPETVMVRTDRSEFINLPVVWDMATVNTLERGTYLVTGELKFAAGYENPDGFVPQIEVTVLPKQAPVRVNLSHYEFTAEAGKEAILIAEISVVDPVDNIHEITLIDGDRDNGYFEIRNGNQLYWVSPDPVAGKTEFFVNFLILDRDGNTLEFLEKLTRHRKSITELFVGNTITPGTDGFNDGWGVPDLKYYEGVRLQIFDRGGQRLFYTLDPGVRWDATVNGNAVPVGTYYWTIEVVETGETRKGLLYVLQK
ncbi:MBG domain-containing protein [Aquiflexum sp.]|uniref:MBG domain-containing protein n=1 Tax=Aquiflexum sp. TaxID=1872584 RepID=UPI003592FEF2